MTPDAALGELTLQLDVLGAAGKLDLPGLLRRWRRQAHDAQESLFACAGTAASRATASTGPRPPLNTSFVLPGPAGSARTPASGSPPASASAGSSASAKQTPECFHPASLPGSAEQLPAARLCSSASVMPALAFRLASLPMLPVLASHSW